MKSKSVFVVAIAAVGVAAALWFLLPTDDPTVSAEKAERPRPARKAHIAEAESAKGKAKVRLVKSADRKARTVSVSPEDEMSPADRKLSEAVQAALDNEDLAGLRKQLAAVRASANAEVRQAAVDALGWFGTKAMSDIVTFIEDPSEDVRDAARTCWDQAITEIDEESVKTTIVEETLLGTKDTDFAETLAFHYNSMDEKRAIESILKVVSGGTKTAAKAVRESYEFITGEEYTTPAAAWQWLKENYEPPEKE